MFRIFHLACLFCISLSIQAEENKQDFTINENSANGYSFDVFLTLSQDTFNALNDSVDVVGSFSGNINPSFAISLNAPYHYFNNSNAGYYLNYNFNRFDLNKQEDFPNTINSIDTTDRGTSVEGYNLYVNASLFYNVGKKIVISKSDTSTKMGFGLGIGYLRAEGDIILTEIPGTPLQTIDIGDFGLVASAFIDHRMGPWIFRFEFSGTEINESPVDFTYGDLSLQVGYTINF